MEYLVDRRGPVNTISHQGKEAQAAKRPRPSVFMQFGVFHQRPPLAPFTPVVPHKTNIPGYNSWVHSSASTSIAVREMKNTDLIISCSLSKHLDYGFVFFQFEGGI